MFVIDKRIEELESKLIKLQNLKDDIEGHKQDAIDMTVETVRNFISDSIDDLISNISMEIDLQEIDSELEHDIEDELREDFVDQVRDEI